MSKNQGLTVETAENLLFLSGMAKNWLSFQKKGNYQIITNFSLLQIEDDSSISCWRYKSAKKILSSHPPTLYTCPLMLDWTHQEQPSPTRYSIIGDLKKGLIYLHLNHNFNIVAPLNVQDELKKGPEAIPISSFFALGK